MLNIRLTVKFRAFGVTFGSIDETVPVLDLTKIVPGPQSLIDMVVKGIPHGKVLFDNRGVKIAIV